MPACAIPELQTIAPVHVNLAPARLIEAALQRQETALAANGAIVACTHPHTGRAARDKYVVVGPAQDRVWWNDTNQRMPLEVFERIAGRVRDHLQARELFVFEGSACAEGNYRLPVRVVAEKAWHALFATWLLRRDMASTLRVPSPQTPVGQTAAGVSRHAERAYHEGLILWHAPTLQLDPVRDGTRTGSAVILNLERGWIVIAGTHYAGEIKKSVFSHLNYALPERDVFPMHCSATMGQAGDAALLFGLSGTGKTTLSADPERRLIGDDEHGWSEQGIFNFEGGCYAKVIKLSAESEPQIHAAIRFGSILENVVLDAHTRRPDYNDATITENSRAAYPLEFIPDAEPSGQGPHPRHVFFLTCDAFGVLPPISKLTPEQAMYHFLSGYTAKIAGTESGIREPQATFSTCFSAPFLTLPPMRYAELLRQRLEKHRSQVWLVNTGWSGGAFGQGERMPLAVTRRLVRAALHDELEGVAFAADPVFGVQAPRSSPDVPETMLQPRSTWKKGADYDRQAGRLAELFKRNFAENFAAAPAPVREAGPR